ncbi:hypothetical protein AS188_15025 [Kocuria flava]|uniref:Uncharacterized protein n=1 Tax=Kocuria flava TaxID=446860 RepID=A0A0U3HIY9_9MICC|nr:hypothetical protein [Kocuria flava]ALU40840.1 hypothetical protein AS188_15025 [Kocuria flava]MCJ8503670.1 hypothetical protein [Kocuria flava]GEO92213.1 hypothetical protein KFL01_15190 [Kocuria flava]
MSSAPSPSSPRPPRRTSRRRQEAASPALAGSGTQPMLLRRAPNVWAFVVLGGLLGAAAGLAAGLLGAGSAQYTQGAVVLFMVSVGVVVGLALGAVVALVLDRISVARARAVTTEVVAGETPAGPPSTREG